MADNPFADFSLERAVGLRWTLRDIQSRRLKMSPVSADDLRVLSELGLIEIREEGARRDHRTERVVGLRSEGYDLSRL
jgi:hypothetical protein